VPKKIGVSLGHEMLYNAKTYRGDYLVRRGAPFPVFPRRKVLEEALGVARTLAEKPRESLITLKEHLTAQIRNELPSFIEKEVMMHKKTFCQEEVRRRIHALF
jgi:polyketide biosynthesis enoyl-CoA hydratase PksI